MSLVKSALAAGGMSVALIATSVSGAFAQGNEPWDVKERTAYVVMMDGTMKTVRLNDKGTAMLMKNAKRVPRGTAFVMSGGQLYMVNAAKMFDRAGNAMFGMF